jgi:D-3-phosphoglycerate dehydrogenase
MDMMKVLALNKISPRGLEIFRRETYEIASEIEHPDAIILRSHDMHGMTIPPTVKAIARAGTGVNNIPVEECSKRGIVVFNTPGANANSVKELVILGLLISSRRVIQGIEWANGLKGRGDAVPGLIEKEKSRFAGPEIAGKTLGVIGLGAVGVMVANAACALGMHVIGYDPFISIDAAWDLSKEIRKARGLESLLSTSDYISIHVPLSDDTEGMINHDRFKMMKKSVRILNFSRAGIVSRKDLKQALSEGKVACYVTDFPDEELLETEGVIAVPHLGASTPEAEDNCAIMAVRQLRGFLERGEITNSVNFPDCELDVSGENRIVVANRNIPAIIGQITAVLAEEGINIADMLNRSRGDNAYNIIDTDTEVSEESAKRISGIEGVTNVRVICC